VKGAVRGNGGRVHDLACGRLPKKARHTLTNTEAKGNGGQRRCTPVQRLQGNKRPRKEGRDGSVGGGGLGLARNKEKLSP